MKTFQRQILAAALLLAAAGGAHAVNPSEGFPEPVYNQSTAQDAAFNVGTGTVRGQLTVGSLKLANDGTVIDEAADLGQAGGGMEPGATYYAQIRETLQTGATVHLASGTVRSLSVWSLKTGTGNELLTAAGLMDASKLSGPLPAISGALVTGLTKAQVGLANVPNTDATNASNLGSGTVPDARFPEVLPAVSGSLLTGLNGSNLGSGTIPNARFPAALPAVSGANLTALNAGALASGTVPDARFPAVLPTVSGANLTNLDAGNLGTGVIPGGRFPATLPTASGVNLTALNASALASGTVPDGRFPATLPTASGVNLTALNASALASGTVPDARFPAALPPASGAALTALNASALTSGIIPDARMPNYTGHVTTLEGGTVTTVVTVPSSAIDSSSVTKQGNAFNGVSQLVKTDGDGALPAISGANLTGLTTGQVGLSAVQNVDQTNASNLTSGTVDNFLVDSSSVTKQGNQFNGVSQLVKTTAEGYLPALDARNLLNVPGTSGGVTGMSPGATYYAQITETLQPGSTVHLASATARDMNVHTLKTGAGGLLTTALGLIDPAKVGDGAFGANVRVSSVTAGAVGEEQLAAASVSETKIQDNSIPAAKLKQGGAGLTPGWLNTTTEAGEHTSLQPLTTFYDLVNTGTLDYAKSTANTYDASASTNPTFGRIRFDSSASSTTNCGYVEGIAPNDFNQTIDPRLNQFWVKNGTATDTSAQRYVLRVASVTTGGTVSSRVHTASVNVDMGTGGDAFADRQLAAPQTLTGWGAIIVPGLGYSIEVCRAGADGTNDPSGLDSFLAGIQIRYAHTTPGE